MTHDLAGRRILITGASGGLGLASAEQLAARGAQIVLAVRNRERGKAAEQRIRMTVQHAALEIADLDLADQSSVDAFAQDQLRRGPLDALINNAGTSMVPRRTLTSDGFELQHATNLLGHFRLTALMMPALEQRAGRVVWLSSVVAWAPRRIDPSLGLAGHYNPSLVYAQSKLACGAIGLELDRRLRAAESAVSSVIAHPGWSNTGLFAQHPGFIPRLLHRTGAPLGSTAADGARSQVHAAVSPEVNGGDYIGPRWVGRGTPWKVRPRRLMSDPQSGLRLWTAAERVTGVSFPIPDERAA
ncbi:SDR family NAD(P)-dependent oxidoreductase [Microlunatus elymi]|uniref:SDR family NAD(P)-dependent oxidoreductase n=1 Tax=Microlunatus elymi TaxID=2596828 RepID=A0A516Q4J0_9ACTN|nr:SDR family NAD(P)-dependent oxidoreductase [Microlunatus elymi]QDP98363.1 SDR family NAD(P)-dependent oxidoreductase [Microlunatus elymi]